MKKIIIIGAGGHGKVLADIAQKNGYDQIFFLDDNSDITTCDGYKIIGKVNDYANYECDFFVAIGNSKIREKLLVQLEGEHKIVVTLIHPDAVIADSVKIGTGTVVMAGAVINSATTVGKGCIINTCASVDHDNQIKDYVHISVGAHTAGNVTVGSNSFIGAGATVINNISICKNCVIGAGAVVVKNINEEAIYKGVPAMKNKTTKIFGGGVEPNRSIRMLPCLEVAA